MKNLCELARDEAVVIHSNTTSLNLSADAARLRSGGRGKVIKVQSDTIHRVSIEKHRTIAMYYIITPASDTGLTSL